MDDKAYLNTWDTCIHIVTFLVTIPDRYFSQGSNIYIPCTLTVWSCRYIAYQLDRSGSEDVFYILASTTSDATEDRVESTSDFLST